MSETITVTLTIEQAEALLQAAGEYVRAVNVQGVPRVTVDDAVLQEAGTAVYAQLRQWALTLD